MAHELADSSLPWAIKLFLLKVPQEIVSSITLGRLGMDQITHLPLHNAVPLKRPALYMVSHGAKNGLSDAIGQQKGRRQREGKRDRKIITIE